MKRIAFFSVQRSDLSTSLDNMRVLFGKPWLHWALQAADQCPEITDIVVSTNLIEVEKCALALGSSKLQIHQLSRSKSPQLQKSSDFSLAETAMLDYLSESKNSNRDLLVLIQARNPFITSEDLRNSIQLLKKSKATSLLSVVRKKKFFWKKNGTPLNCDLKRRPQQQELEGLLMENGAIYMSSVGAIKKSKKPLSGKIAVYEMPVFSGFEIEEASDWAICENLLKNYGYQKEPRDYSKIKLFLTDVDGVLTDAGMYYSENGDALKKFNTLDGMGLQLLMKAGIQVGIVTGENTPIVAKRAEKLKIKIVKQGIQDKLTVVKEICQGLGLDLGEVAYIGDDINDFEILSEVGFAACPINAVEKIKNIPGILRLTKAGGFGVVREFIELILE